ncbi:UPF0561 protein C2orf68 homolog isoform X2 [Cygnus olor]|uniref:UPF0561 protein C2orf68 homolog isoform X2 n=1 Tax=Cygnus olor TaxID=8869 RepID=UPI001ADE862F|nr:UPF0561 protein C2orf68 homolog isoform X2 [Cygnus olor]
MRAAAPPRRPAGVLKGPRPGTGGASCTSRRRFMEAAAGWRCRRPGGRLDMSHGFVRHIRRNQLARDAYERSVRQARGRARGRHTAAPPRPRRPDQPVYRPRRPGGGASGDGTAGSPPPPAPPEPRCPRLFCLDFEGDDGRITSVIVHQPPGAPPAACPVPAGAGRAQQAPGDAVTPGTR